MATTKKIQDIEGIGPSYGEKLSATGVKTVEQLLEKGKTAQGRNELSAKSGIDENLILKWVNMADLFRIKGVGGEYAELLEAAGVDTVKELRNRNAENLYQKMAEVNQQKKLVRLVPGKKKVEKWVTEAQQLSPMIEYW